MVVTIRNNAPGGGGNDWAIDDIAIATCLPNMKYSPSITPNVCSGNAMTIYDTVRSYFNNYVYYKWQRSTNGGSTWTDVTGPLGPATPIWNGTAWEYVSSYTIPPANTTLANSGDKYRLIVATSLSNLSDNSCRHTDPTTIVTLNVLDCGPALNTKFLTLTGKVTNKKATIKWTTGIEEEYLYYDIEKSLNGYTFGTIGTLNSYFIGGVSQNNYSFTDPEDINGKAYYRIKMRNTDNQATYSRVLMLSNSNEGFSIFTIANPFNSELHFDISSVKSGIINAELVDQFGKPVRRKSFNISAGINQLVFDNTGGLQTGIYILKLEMNDAVIYRKVMKQTR